MDAKLLPSLKESQEEDAKLERQQLLDLARHLQGRLPGSPVSCW